VQVTKQESYQYIFISPVKMESEQSGYKNTTKVGDKPKCLV